jgi:hypothetical protein
MLFFQINVYKFNSTWCAAWSEIYFERPKLLSTALWKPVLITENDPNFVFVLADGRGYREIAPNKIEGTPILKLAMVRR